MFFAYIIIVFTFYCVCVQCSSFTIKISTYNIINAAENININDVLLLFPSEF
jgi:hypothetical protein